MPWLHKLLLGPAAILVVIVAACSTGAAAPILSAVGGPVDKGAAVAAASAAPAEPDAAGGQGGASGSGSEGAGSSSGGTTSSGGGQTYDINRPDLLIIKTGSLDLQVAGLDATLAAASVKVSALGGYASGSERKGDNDQAVAIVTYRIPAARWDEALVALRGLADKVISEATQSQDVTSQVVDLGARITNLQATERALQAIMEKATKISDILDVQTQLTDVRGQIEQLSTEKAHLSDQAAYSTLTVTFLLKPQPAVITTQNKYDATAEVDRASATLVDVLQALATAGIWFALVWLPILFTLGVLGLILLVIARRLRRVRPGGGALIAPTGSES